MNKALQSLLLLVIWGIIGFYGANMYRFWINIDVPLWWKLQAWLQWNDSYWTFVMGSDKVLELIKNCEYLFTGTNQDKYPGQTWEKVISWEVSYDVMKLLDLTSCKK